MSVRSLPVKSRKGLARDVVGDVTDTDYWTQNGTDNGHLFATFIFFFFNRRGEKSSKKVPINI